MFAKFSEFNVAFKITFKKNKIVLSNLNLYGNLDPVLYFYNSSNFFISYKPQVHEMHLHWQLLRDWTINRLIEVLRFGTCLGVKKTIGRLMRRTSQFEADFAINRCKNVCEFVLQFITMLMQWLKASRLGLSRLKKPFPNLLS